MGRIVVATVLAAVAALGLGAAPAPAVSLASSPPHTFTDTTGDAGTAADIATIKVSNDGNGQYLFDVAFQTPYGDSALFALYFNTDNSASTGDPALGGADYLLVDDHSAHTFYLETWSGTEWVDAPTIDTVKVTIAADLLGLTMSINRSELGGSGAFSFYAISFDGDGSDGHVDAAPSASDVWQYTLQPTISLSLTGARAGVAKAGGLWVVAIVVNRSDTHATVGSEGTIACTASSGSTKLVVVTRAFISGGSGKGTAAVCGFAVAKSLKHKAVTGMVTVAYAGQSVKQSFTTHVK